MSDSELSTSPPCSAAPPTDEEFGALLFERMVSGVELVRPNAESLMSRINSRKKVLGDSHPSFIDLHLSAAKNFHTSGEAQLGEQQFTLALDIAETNFGRLSPSLIPILTEMASFFASHDRFFDARVLLMRASEICDAQVHLNHLQSEISFDPTCNRPTSNRATVSAALMKSIKQLETSKKVSSCNAEVQVSQVNRTQSLRSSHDVREMINSARSQPETVNVPHSTALTRLKQSLANLKV